MVYEQCKFGGWCIRIKGHTGTHTKTPSVHTWEYDMNEREKAILAFLDFETPYWADILDD